MLATSWTGNANNVAVYAGGVRFYRPLQIGHLVEDLALDAHAVHLVELRADIDRSLRPV